METVQQNGCFTLFLVNSPLTYILFPLSMYAFGVYWSDLHYTDRRNNGLSGEYANVEASPRLCSIF